jgi:hypothetical protein
MALCPFAEKRLVGYDGGAYTGGPFRVVLHTTEGSFASALAIFKIHYASHFLVDGQRVIQLVDTARAGSAMRHPSAGPETNRLSAVQIEMVGFAGKPKDPLMLANVRRLCRWLETEHGIPRVWPNGYCTPAKDAHDAGHHNRDAYTWETRGGYYGHEHVPGNIHWDPALTAAETDFLMADQDELSP